MYTRKYMYYISSIGLSLASFVMVPSSFVLLEEARVRHC